MLNVLNYIKEKKRQFQEYREKKSQLEMTEKTAELQRLRQERLKVEGRAKLEEARLREINRIERAKQKNPSKLRTIGMGLAKLINERKEKQATQEDKPKGLDFGGTAGSPFKFGK